ncbi:hypothetical protein ACQP1G_34320 [Nocardia sp. CA-107356]
METLIIVVVILVVLGLVSFSVQLASRPPRNESRWDRADVDDDYDRWESD